MNKIKTIFKRDWQNAGKITKELDDEVLNFNFAESVATEKLDGTNVRITVRNHLTVRVEKRRNPDKYQKAKGIEEPWYVDASEYESQDKWIYDGLKNTDLSEIPDGEWSGELVGKNIQGNPLGLDKNIIVFFSLGEAPTFENVPTTFKELKEWLPKQKSKYGIGNIEGIVWRDSSGRMVKIKTKDFR